MGRTAPLHRRCARARCDGGYGAGHRPGQSDAGQGPDRPAADRGARARAPAPLGRHLWQRRAGARPAHGGRRVDRRRTGRHGGGAGRRGGTVAGDGMTVDRARLAPLLVSEAGRSAGSPSGWRIGSAPDPASTWPTPEAASSIGSRNPPTSASSHWPSGSPRGVASVIGEYGLPWTVQRLGCRAEYWFRPVPPRNGGEAAPAVYSELERYMHLAALNR